MPVLAQRRRRTGGRPCRIQGEHQGAENAGTVTELGSDDIAIRAIENLTAIDVAAEPAAEARTNERQQARLIHDAAAHHDALGRHGDDQLRAQLAEIVRLDFPLRMGFFDLRSDAPVRAMIAGPLARPSRQSP